MKFSKGAIAIFSILAIYALWYFVNSKSERAGNAYVLLMLLAALMYNRQSVFAEINSLTGFSIGV